METLSKLNPSFRANFFEIARLSNVIFRIARDSETISPQNPFSPDKYEIIIEKYMTVLTWL